MNLELKRETRKAGPIRFNKKKERAAGEGKHG